MIYDCFSYWDEDLLLDLRLNVLDKFVDKFVVTESLFTHSGKRKKQNFNINHYPKFKDKIIYILLDKEPENLYEINENTKDKVGLLRMNSLKRIQKQYNALSLGLKDANDDDLILLSDCDEIPDLSNFDKNILNNNILLFKQKIYYYKFNLQHSGLEWFGTKGCKKKTLSWFLFL